MACFQGRGNGQNPRIFRNVAVCKVATGVATGVATFPLFGYYCKVQEMEYISIREFARRMGVADTSIRRAIKAGNISKGYDKKRKRSSICYEVARKEYEATHDPLKTTLKPRKRKAPKAERPQSSPEEQAVQGVENTHGEYEEDDGQMAIDFNKSRAEKMAYDAKIKKLEYEERQGKLVDREQVYKALFAIGKELRVEFQALPDRIIDDVMASSTRNEGHGILTKSIAKILEGIAGVGERMDKQLNK